MVPWLGNEADTHEMPVVAGKHILCAAFSMMSSDGSPRHHRDAAAEQIPVPVNETSSSGTVPEAAANSHNQVKFESTRRIPVDAVLAGIKPKRKIYAGIPKL